jgi:hypothetical protein
VTGEINGPAEFETHIKPMFRRVRLYKGHERGYAGASVVADARSAIRHGLASGQRTPR